MSEATAPTLHSECPLKKNSEHKYGGISAWQHSSENISQEKRCGNRLSCENMKADIFRIYDAALQPGDSRETVALPSPKTFC